MKTSWTKTFRRLAAGCVVAGSSAFSSAACYAAIAMDSATDPVYADGWHGQTHAGTAGGGVQLTPGDNGGFGFTQWNFDSAYVASGNYSKPFGYNYGNYADLTIKDIAPGGGNNNIGTAWHQGLGPNSGTNRAGRGFSLGIGETLKVTIDNPNTTTFYKGFFVRLSGGTGGVDGNICNSFNQGCTVGGTPVRKANLNFFKYANPMDHWHFEDASGNTNTGVTISDTAAAGAVFSVKRTGANTYDVLLDSLGGGPDFQALGSTFMNPTAELDWIEFTFFNTVGTDFYISNMMIVPEPGTAALLLLGAGGALLGTARRRKDD